MVLPTTVKTLTLQQLCYQPNLKKIILMLFSKIPTAFQERLGCPLNRSHSSSKSCKLFFPTKKGWSGLERYNLQHVLSVKQQKITLPIFSPVPKDLKLHLHSWDALRLMWTTSSIRTLCSLTSHVQNHLSFPWYGSYPLVSWLYGRRGKQEKLQDLPAAEQNLRLGYKCWSIPEGCIIHYRTVPWCWRKC